MSWSDPVKASRIVAADRAFVSGAGALIVRDDAVQGHAQSPFGDARQLGAESGGWARLRHRLELELRRYTDSRLGYDYGYGTFTVETAFGGRFQLARKLYLFTGLGPVWGTDWVKGSREREMVIGGRLPAQVTYYLTPALALSGAVGAGVEAIIWSFEGSDDSYTTGHAIGALYDLSLGLRFL